MRIWIFAASLMAMLMSVNAASAGQRVAFVVGNGDYKHVPKLANPADDAKAMATLLRSVGFDVIEGTDLTRDAMMERLLAFGRKAQGADLALFYYAGQGLSVDGTGYLLPVDSDIKSEMDLKLGGAINIDLTLDQTMSDAKIKLVFLDSGRDDPFAHNTKPSASRNVRPRLGLAEMKSGGDTLIAFATGPGGRILDGEKGAHSPFTKALLANIAAPGIEIQQAMTKVRAQVSDETNGQQMPWGHSDLESPVYLNPASNGAAK